MRPADDKDKIANEELINTTLDDDDKQDVDIRTSLKPSDIRTQLFNTVASEFSCDLGKVGNDLFKQLFDVANIFHFCFQQESRRERNEKGLKDIFLTYGEIEFKSFFQVFRWIQKTYKDKDPDCWHNAFNNPGGTFIDLGHGTGKGILAATFMH